MSRENISSGSAWEGKIGYSRAVKVGNQVFLSGTTATNDDGEVVSPGDPGGQTAYILKKVEAALKDAGATLKDVVRTRMFVTDMSQWEAVGNAHGEVFSDIRPATTIVEIKSLISPEHMVEIEVDAIIS